MKSENNHFAFIRKIHYKIEEENLKARILKRFAMKIYLFSSIIVKIQ